MVARAAIQNPWIFKELSCLSSNNDIENGHNDKLFQLILFISIQSLSLYIFIWTIFL